MRALIIAAAMAMSVNANAATSGNDLLKSITHTDQAERLWALGFINGVTDAGQGEYLCAPNGANVGQAKDIVLQFLNEVPSQRHKPAVHIILAALSIAWPCDDEKPTASPSKVRKTT